MGGHTKRGILLKKQSGPYGIGAQTLRSAAATAVGITVTQKMTIAYSLLEASREKLQL